MSERPRIGVMIPAADGTAEPDFQRLFAPFGVTVHSHRLWHDSELDPQTRFDRMNSEIVVAARYLSKLDVAAIAYCCTTGSFYRGSGWDNEILQLIESTSGGTPAFATSPSVVKALRSVGAKKISVITPYPDWNNEKLRLYLEAKGLEVLNVDGHPKPASGKVAIYNHDPEEIVEFASEKCSPDADALLCSCTDWRSLEIVSRLEEHIGKTVITSNQATIWDIAKRLDVSGPIDGYGSLLKGLGAAVAS